MPLEVLTNAPSGGWHSVTNRELKCRPVKMPAPTGCAVFQGDGGKQVIYLQIKQQETFPHKAHMKGQTWRAPDQTKQRILFLRTSWLHCRCGIENLFGTLSGLFFFFNYGGNHFSLCNQFTKTLLLPYTDMDGKWQNVQVWKGSQGREVVLGHQVGAGAGRSGQNLGFQTLGGNELCKAWW